LPDKFTDHGKVEELQEKSKIDVESIKACLNSMLRKLK